MSQITDKKTLEALFNRPAERVLNKVVPGLDPHTRRFISRCPLAMLTTQNAMGELDISPRGGKPGFIHIVDDSTLLLPEYAGNNRVDTLHNGIPKQGEANVAFGMLCLVPGMGEVLRLKGRAKLFSQSEATQDLFAHFTEQSSKTSKAPKVVIEFKLSELYFQCAAALNKSKIWSAPTQHAPDDFPSIYKIIADQIAYNK